MNTEAKCEWHECDNVKKALKKQLIDTIDPMYLQALCNCNMGFANVTLKAILTFLFRSYGQLMLQELQENTNELNKPWDPNTPFENLIDQIENCHDIAEAGGQPFTTQQLVDMAYTLVFNTGLYFDDCKTWVHHPIAEKTWDNFKMHF